MLRGRLATATPRLMNCLQQLEGLTEVWPRTRVKSVDHAPKVTQHVGQAGLVGNAQLAHLEVLVEDRGCIAIRERKVNPIDFRLRSPGG